MSSKCPVDEITIPIADCKHLDKKIDPESLLIKKMNHFTYYIYLDDEMIGAFHFFDYSNDRFAIYLDSYQIIESKRGLGIGKCAFHAIADYLKTKKIYVIELRITYNAIGFWESIGVEDLDYETWDENRMYEYYT